MLELNIGDKWTEGNTHLTIVDKDRLCYKVLNEANHSIRTISKDLVQEFILYVKKNPSCNAMVARDDLKGTSEIDNFEYGYNATLYGLAKASINIGKEVDKQEETIVIKHEPVKKDYSDNELAERLVDIYNKASRDGQKSYAVHIFGLKYGEALSGKNTKKIIEIANELFNPLTPISESFHVEISKGIRMYDFIKSKKYGLYFYEDNEEIEPNNTLNDLTIPDFIMDDKTLENKKDNKYRNYITAIKTKPFLLLAGISGTGKSRIVRELARACWDNNSKEYNMQKPTNFEMVQVKPNWHDSSELIGYVSRVSGKPKFIAGEFLKFIIKAWEHQDKPYFLCLDEMNLAPVEQYFAEYLSVIESRKTNDKHVTTDPILKYSSEDWYTELIEELTISAALRNKFKKEGICIPQNLIVVGTVNMDETTFSFSRKVLDRAMTIEMNDVNLDAGLEIEHEDIEQLSNCELVGTCVEGKDVYSDYKDICVKVISYLKAVNNTLEHTPFKIAYRTRNEFLLYVVNNLPYNKDKSGNLIPIESVVARAVDEITSMKILSRIEGDDSKVERKMLQNLKNTISEQLMSISKDFDFNNSVSLSKLDEMYKRLDGTGYTSFWS